jgi:NAD(P)-dependent dehydrogenase (short-subunit alcohol dehydrogenase family)
MSASRPLAVVTGASNGIGFEALMTGKERATAGSVRTRLEAVASRILPDRIKAELHRGMAQPGSAER